MSTAECQGMHEGRWRSNLPTDHFERMQKIEERELKFSEDLQTLLFKLTVVFSCSTGVQNQNGLKKKIIALL